MIFSIIILFDVEWLRTPGVDTVTEPTIKTMITVLKLHEAEIRLHA